MAHIHELLKQLRASNPELAAEIQREVDHLTQRRAFGLNFERHTPEAVELPSRRVRVGDKVHVLPPRGESPKAENDRLWRVAAIDGEGDERVARLEDVSAVSDAETRTALYDDLVFVAEFRDPIYPGLVSTGKVERGGDKPFHAVINAENYHALQALMFTHRGKVDAIYIDPPYNTGARDWKYNNDYVEGDDMYRHSKWLAFMERRLELAKELLNPDDSVLIVTIDEKEYLRLGLLLEQMFPEARIQMVTSVISSQGSVREGGFTRSDEYIFVAQLGGSRVGKSQDDMLNEGQSATKSQLWFQYVRTGKGNLRAESKNLFFPVFVDSQDGRIVEIGRPLPLDVDRNSVTAPDGVDVVWPISAAGEEARWRTGTEVARRRASAGLLRATRSASGRQKWSLMTVNQGTEDRIARGEVVAQGYSSNGAAILVELENSAIRAPKTTWNRTSHNAGWHGSKLVAAAIPGRKFPYPKSLYAVEDALRFFVANKPDATIVDFFSGSGTTAHAVMRLNKQDSGRRCSISVTNNEVSADEQRKLRASGLRPGDAEWEQWGICDYITKPRIEAAITGKTPNGDPIKGDYKFTDEFPMADGFEENVEFFTLTYEAPMRVQSHRSFGRIAPLLWLRAGSRGRRIDALPNGWDVADAYGVIDDMDQSDAFVDAMVANPEARIAFVVTDEDRFFEAIAHALPEEVETVRLYDSYLRNSEIDAMRGAR